MIGLLSFRTRCVNSRFKDLRCFGFQDSGMREQEKLLHAKDIERAQYLLNKEYTFDYWGLNIMI